MEMQANAYRKAFGDSIAYDPDNDVPTYEGYFVERAEINSPADEKNPNFTEKFNPVDAETEATKDWPQQQPDVVEDKYVDPILTFPLGPLQNRAGAPTSHTRRKSLSSMPTAERKAKAAIEQTLPPRKQVRSPTRVRGHSALEAVHEIRWYAKIEAEVTAGSRPHTNCCVFSILRSSRAKVIFIE